MKKALFIIIAIMILTNSKDLLSVKNKAKGDLLGESFNFEGKAKRSAISFALANTGGFSEKNISGSYSIPQLIAKLPKKIDLPLPGPLETVDEIPSSTSYYDGTSNLNKITMTCKIYANPTDCLHSSECGWCGSQSGCIAGNNLGPLEACVKSSYIFSAPFPNWNPQTRVINENVGGAGLIVVNK